MVSVRYKQEQGTLGRGKAQLNHIAQLNHTEGVRLDLSSKVWKGVNEELEKKWKWRSLQCMWVGKFKWLLWAGVEGLCGGSRRQASEAGRSQGVKGLCPKLEHPTTVLKARG